VSAFQASVIGGGIQTQACAKPPAWAESFRPFGADPAGESCRRFGYEDPAQSQRRLAPEMSRAYSQLVPILRPGWTAKEFRMTESQNRRDFLKTSVLGTAAASAVASSAGAAVPETAVPIVMPPEAVNGMPVGRMGKLQVSRIFIGCNQVSGYSHSRDLRYVSSLMRAYMTEERVMDTWQLCEEAGINMVLSDPFEKPVRIMKRYRSERGGKIQWLSEIHPAKPYDQISLADMRENLKQVQDNRPDAIYVQGGIGDSFVRRGAVGDLAEFLSDMKATGLPSGIGGHSIETVKAVVQAGAVPDFFMKTFHSDNYWSATPRDQRVEFNVDSASARDHDNIWCIHPEAERETMSKVAVPWVAFKVLAAGALDPKEAFHFAFSGGADFICVGMFDFQVKGNIRLAKEILTGPLSRTRPWYA